MNRTKSDKYDQLKHILGLFYSLSETNSYLRYRNAIHTLASYAMKEVSKIERGEKRK